VLCKTVARMFGIQPLHQSIAGGLGEDLNHISIAISRRENRTRSDRPWQTSKTLHRKRTTDHG
jgi:hypothetical protein